MERRSFLKGVIIGLISSVLPFPSNTVTWGQRTLESKSSLDRINNERLLIQIKKDVYQIVYENVKYIRYNDKILRNKIKRDLKKYGNNLKNKRMIYNFEAICNETNNTPEIVDYNCLVVDFNYQCSIELLYNSIRVTFGPDDLSF